MVAEPQGRHGGLPLRDRDIAASPRACRVRHNIEIVVFLGRHLPKGHPACRYVREKEQRVSIGANGKVNVAVIGLGWPGQRHLEGYEKLPDVNIAAICDMSESLLTSTHARF